MQVNKLIKSATTYRAELPTADLMRRHLKELPFTEITGFDSLSKGFAHIDGFDEELIEFQDGYAFGFRIDEKVVPASAINEEVKTACQKIEQEQGYKPGRNQRKEIREQIVDTLNRKAIAKTTRLTVFYSDKYKLFIIPTPVKRTCDIITSAMVKAIGSIEATTIYVSNAKHGLTERLKRLINGDCDSFGKFDLIDKVVLKGLSGRSLSVTMDDVSQAIGAITEALDDLMLVDSVRLKRNGEGISFTFSNDFRIRSVDLHLFNEDGESDYDELFRWKHEAAVQTLLMAEVIEELCDMFRENTMEGSNVSK